MPILWTNSFLNSRQKCDFLLSIRFCYLHFLRKYAKIVNEETKQCEVGIGNPDAPYKTIVVPAVTHEEVIPADYDEDGNLIKPEEVIVIVDEPEHEETMTVGDYYKSIGMTEMDVEQAYDGNWYVEGYAPDPSVEYQNEQIRKQRQDRYIAESDPIRLDYDEALARGEETAEQLKQEWLDSKTKIRKELPYIEES